jgi:hypothetical protein
MRRLNPLGGASPLWTPWTMRRHWTEADGERAPLTGPQAEQNQKQRTNDLPPKPDKFIRYRQGRIA